MVSPHRLCVFIGGLFVLVFLFACKSSPGPESTAQSPQPLVHTNVTYHPSYDEEIRKILELADEGEWNLAQARAEVLYQKAPEEEMVRRVYDWVRKQGQLIRDQRLEDRIRGINAENSVFNPTIPRLLKESKDRGLPPRKDVRDTVEEIESMPYIPPTFNQTNTVIRSGTMFDIESKEGRMAKVLDKKISLHLDNVTLENIIFTVGDAEGVNFVADKSLPAFQQKLSVNFDQVQLGELLRYISRNLEVKFQVGDELIWIVDGKNEKDLQETRFYRLRNGFVLPAEFGATQIDRTRVENKGVVTITEREEIEKFVQDGAPSNPFIEQAIMKFFEGEYMIDYERNLIMARGTRDQLALLEQIIQEFDRVPQQVFIEARFITVTEAAFMQLGAQWETGRDLLSSSRSPRDFTGLGTDVGLGLQETFGNILGRKNLTATLTALEQSGESQTLSAPRVTLVNNLPARISDGKVQYYYEEYTVSQQILERRSSSQLVPSGKPTKLTSGVSLEVMASIGGDGQSILLALKPEVNQEVQLVTFATVTDRNDEGDVVSSFDIKLPESRTQSLATRVIVKSGQTVVMGGVLEREQRTFVESVPVLSNIPILGAAFRKRTELDKPRYLLIFVTATLISDNGEFVVYEEAAESGGLN